LKFLLPPTFRSNIRKGIVSISVKHIYGPKKIKLSANEAAVTCIVKNAEFYMEQFIRHYSQMGFRHIFFLDNGSNDQTITIGKRHNNVSIFQSKLPIEIYQGLLKKYLAQNFVKGGWCLDADQDEFFDYPFSDVIELRCFLEYLNMMNYTAVVTQLLDMFSDKPASHLRIKQDENLKMVYQYYDTSEINKVKYNLSDFVEKHGNLNESSSEKTALYFGGIRKTLYGNDCLLTKHSLFLPGKGLDLFPNVHFVNNARLADVSCVMLHYKLISNALDIASQNKDYFTECSQGYSDFINFIKKNPDYKIKRNTAVKLKNVNELVDSDFLFISEIYSEYVIGIKNNKILIEKKAAYSGKIVDR
jgi:Glycosyl transferase family 2